MIIFETERLRVRQFETGDQDNYFTLSGNYSVMQYIRAVKNKAQSDAYLLQMIEDYKLAANTGRWAVEEKTTNIFVGSFAIIPLPSQPAELQLGYSLTPANWGKGYATELTQEGLVFFKARHMNEKIYGVTESPHTSSQKVLLKTGFRYAGRMTEDEKELNLYVIDRDEILTARGG